MNGDNRRKMAGPRRGQAWTPAGWLRFGRYRWLRVLRLSDSPRRISRGVFAGTFIAFTPFFGLHFGLAPLIAWILNGSVLASLAAVLVCNPLTFPAMAFASYRLGTSIIGPPDHLAAGYDTGDGIVTIRDNSLALVTEAEFDWNAVVEALRVIFLPYLVGGVLIGAISGIALGWLSYRLVSAYQKRRLTFRRTAGSG